MLGKQTHRMQNGMMYNDLDPELMQARQRTMALTTAYDQSYSQSPAEREALLAKILGKIGKNVHFEPTFRCEFGKNISIGDNFLRILIVSCSMGLRSRSGIMSYLVPGWVFIQLIMQSIKLSANWEAVGLRQ